MNTADVDAPSRGSAARLAAPIVALLVIVASAALVIFLTPPETLRTILQRREFWLLEALFIGVVVTTVIEARRIAIDRSLLLQAVAIGVLSGVLSAAIPPRTNRIYYDEHIYQGVAQNLTDLHLAQMCNDGTMDYGRLQCSRGEFNKEPNGYPYVLSIVYRIFGVHERAAFVFNNVVAGATTFVVVLLGWALFKDRRSAWLGGAVVALLPMQLWWTNTAAAEPSAALWTAVALLAAVHFTAIRTRSALIWMIVVAAFAMTFRPESILIAPLLLITLALRAPSALAATSTWWGVAGGAVLCLPSVLHLASVRNESWGAPGARFSLAYVSSNLPANTWFYLGNDDRFPALIAAAAVIGLCATQHRKASAVLTAYFLMFWGIFIVFYAGSYYYGADVRYSLLSHVPLALMAGEGLCRVVQWIGRSIPERTALAGVVGATLVQFSWTAPVARSTGEEAWGARADIGFARTFVAQLPRNSIVLSHNPTVFHLWGVNAAQLSLVQTDPAYVRGPLFDRYAGGVYAHWGFWCNVQDPRQKVFCDEALKSYRGERIASGAERDYIYGLYKLSPPREIKTP